MKTKQLFFSGIFLAAFCFNANAQVTQATNAISSTSYVGTSNNFDVVFKRQAIASGLLSTNKTSFGVNSLAMPNSVSVGTGAGSSSSGTGFNTFIGNYSGANNSGNNNIHIGYLAGNSNEGSRNIFIGNQSGADDGTGGDGNICIGHGAGQYEYSGNKLIIEASQNETSPLIWGDFALNQLKLNAKVGVGNVTSFPTAIGAVNVSNYNLFVTGGILTDQVRVILSNGGTWADYVFAKDYKLPTLSEVEDFIAKNGHLPNVPSAKQVQEDGIELGEIAKIQQEKIEELTLYILQLNKENEKQAKENAALNERLLKLEILVENLTK